MALTDHLKQIGSQMDHIKRIDNIMADQSPVKLLSQIVDINTKFTFEAKQAIDNNKYIESKIKKILIEHQDLNQSFIFELEAYKNASRVKRFIFKFSYYKAMNHFRDLIFHSSLRITKDSNTTKADVPVIENPTRINKNKIETKNRDSLSAPKVRVKRRSSTFSEVSRDFLERSGASLEFKPDHPQPKIQISNAIPIITKTKSEEKTNRLLTSNPNPNPYTGNIDMGDFSLDNLSTKVNAHRPKTSNSAFSPPTNIYKTFYSTKYNCAN